MFVCIQKDAKQCCDATKIGCTHCSGRLLSDKQKSKSHETYKRSGSAFYNESGSAFYNESGSESGSESSPRFITYRMNVDSHSFTL